MICSRCGKECLAIRFYGYAPYSSYIQSVESSCCGASIIYESLIKGIKVIKTNKFIKIKGII
jgi:hypothetical protein